jgi:cysteine desulfurase
MSQGVNSEPRPHEIYLDNNATTALDPRVLEAMTEAWRTCGANPASQHAAGRRARRLVEESRERILELLGARTSGMGADRLIFTSGGTEANQLALRGLVLPEFFPRLVALADIEHPSIRATAAKLEQEAQQFVELRRYENEIGSGTPAKILRLPVLPSGVVDLQAIAAQRQLPEARRPQLICLMLASNETGVLQPVREACELAQNTGMLVHTDAVQAVGKIPVNFRELGVSTMTVAPHKFHGPVGIGGLVVRQGVKLAPQLLGGFQQEGLRAGTESVALAVGFRRALEFAQEEFETHTKQMRILRDEFAAILQKNIPNSIVIGQDVPRTPHTLCISFPPLDRQALVMALDQAGVACSTGSACASGSSEPSPTLVAMGLPASIVGSAIRFSFNGWMTPLDMIDAADRIINTVKHLRRSK